MPLPQMPKPSKRHEVHTLNFRDGSSRDVFVTNELYPTGSKVIFSKTDKQGFITHVNDAFIIASGWEESDLIGQPHYIMRHPHMPSEPFREMWDVITSGGRWTGCVKNLRKDGSHYWIKAIVHAVHQDGEVVGYQSSRHKISQATIDEHEELYAHMRVNEARLNNAVTA